MARKKDSKGQSGGVSISGDNITVGGDVVGRDKTTVVSHGLSAGEAAALARQFALIRRKIDERSDDPGVDKEELKETVDHIEQEVKKGEEANPSKVERWLRFLANMADDIFAVTAAALENPAAGVAKTIQLIVARAKAEAH